VLPRQFGGGPQMAAVEEHAHVVEADDVHAGQRARALGQRDAGAVHGQGLVAAAGGFEQARAFGQHLRLRHRPQAQAGVRHHRLVQALGVVEVAHVAGQAHQRRHHGAGRAAVQPFGQRDGAAQVAARPLAVATGGGGPAGDAQRAQHGHLAVGCQRHGVFGQAQRFAAVVGIAHGQRALDGGVGLHVAVAQPSAQRHQALGFGRAFVQIAQVAQGLDARVAQRHFVGRLGALGQRMIELGHGVAVREQACRGQSGLESVRRGAARLVGRFPVLRDARGQAPRRGLRLFQRQRQLAVQQGRARR